MIKANNLISLFQTMYTEHWKYEWGASQEGCVDCSGAFTYAFRKLGGSISHGSNTIARKYIKGELLPISKAKPGMAAFKRREWTESQTGNTWYGSQPGDIYHIGLVDYDTSFVLNAKGKLSGFCRDSIKSWDYVAYLKNVDYSEGGEVMEMAIVVLPTGASGSTVNMRSKPDKRASIVERVPVGAIVSVLEDQGTWVSVKYGGKSGYMMSNFIEYSGQDEGTETDEGSVVLSVSDLNEVNNLLNQIENATEKIGSIIGRG